MNKAGGTDRKTWIGRGGLRLKIITWSFVPSAIILLAVALVTYFSYQQVTEQLVIERDRELIRLSAAQLGSELIGYGDVLISLARTAPLYDGDPPAREAALQRAANRLVIFDGGVVALNTYGTVVAAYPDRPDLLGRDWSDRDSYRSLVRSQEPTFSNLVYDGPGGAPVVVLAVPILAEEGEFRGALLGMFRVGAISVSAFYGGIVKQRIGENGTTILVDAAGLAIYHSDTERVGQDLSWRGVVQEVLGGGVGATRTRDSDGRDIVAGYAPIPGTSWGLVTEESWDALISGSRPYQRYLLVLLALGVILPVVAVVAGLRRLMRPIHDLIDAARAAATGQFGRTIHADTDDEIEELATQFNRMSIELQASYADLERRVDARTRELATLLEVTRNVASTLDLQAVMGLILEQLWAVVDCSGAGILILEGGSLHTLAYRGPISQEEARGWSFPLERAGVNREVVLRGMPIIVDDILEESMPLARAFRETAGDALTTTFKYIRSWMGVPLIVKDRVIGMLSVEHREPGHYTVSQAALALAFATQAAVAIDNARLYAETRRRADEVQTLFAVQQAIASPLQWNAVLQLIADEARRLTGTLVSVVYLLDGDELESAVVSAASGHEQFAGTRVPLEQSASGIAIKLRQPVLIPDAGSDPRINPGLRDIFGVRCLLVAPLLTESGAMGAILVANKPDGTLDEDDRRILEMLASGAVIQLQNARLFNEAKQRAVELEALYRADEELYRHLQLDDVLRALVDVAADILHAEKSAVMAWDAQLERLIVRAARGFSPEAIENMAFEAREGMVGRVAETGEALCVPDTLEDQRVVQRVTGLEGIRSFMHVPILVAGQVFGVFNVSYTQPRAFGRDEVRLFSALAQRAGLVIENAQLYERGQQVAAMEERQRLARDLHDAVTQTLFSASLIAEVLPKVWERNAEMGKERLEDLRQLTRGALAEMRTLLLELRPSALTEANLGDLLRQLGEAATGRSRVPVTVALEGERALPSSVQVALYRIAQEALNNMIKHAGATQAQVTLRLSPDSVELLISDDGRGFDPRQAGAARLGLGIMAERAHAIGAQLTIDSASGAGTRVAVVWPG